MRVARLLVAGALLGAFAGTTPVPARAQGATAYYEFLMARRLEAEGNNPAALAALERAAAADPASAEIRAGIAAFHLRRGQRAEAEKAARAALALNEKNVEANRTLGLALTAAAEPGDRGATPAQVSARKEAIVCLERAIAGSVVPDPATQDTLGRLYLLDGEAAKAVQILTQVLGQNPNSVRSRLSLARAHAAATNLDAAIDTLAEVVLDEPRVASALGQYLEIAGRLVDAAQAYTIALSAQPNAVDLKLRRIAVLHRASQFARAAEFAADGRKQHPTDLRFAHAQGRALFDGGDRAGGIAVIEAALKAAPSDVQSLFTLQDLYHEAGRDADAERTLRQIVSLEPSNANALNTLGYLLAVRGERLDEAIRLVRRALDADPDNGAFLDSLGWAHFRKGELDNAEKYLSAAASRLPENSEIQDHLGDLHARRGRWQDAIAAWTRALGGDDQGIDRPALERKISDARTKLRP